MTTSDRVVAMVGAFPPPVHGMAAVNAAVRARLQNYGIDTRVFDISATSLRRGIFTRLGRVPLIFRALMSLIFMRRLRGQTLYMSVSGGFGQVYELFFMSLARLRGMRVFLHHHSFAYLDSRKVLTRGLIRLAGEDATHVALSPQMADRLQENYKVKRAVPVSNAVFFFGAEDVAEGKNRPLEIIGFLGNIAAEKGIFEFLDLCGVLRDQGLPVQARLAGPFQDEQTEYAVRVRLEALPAVEYMGPKYGDEKRAFFEGLDVFVFPTQYVNEAEPLTVHEAMSQGCPVITYGRGCIPEIVGDGGGRVIEPGRVFVPEALDQIDAWLDDPAAFQLASKSAAKRFHETYSHSYERLRALLRELAGCAVDAGLSRVQRIHH